MRRQQITNPSRRYFEHSCKKQLLGCMGTEKPFTAAVTYGTFDLFHVGHVRLLDRMFGLSEQLYVGVSTDEFNAVKGKKAVNTYKREPKLWLHAATSVKYSRKVHGIKNVEILRDFPLICSLWTTTGRDTSPNLVTWRRSCSCLGPLPSRLRKLLSGFRTIDHGLNARAVPSRDVFCARVAGI